MKNISDIKNYEYIKECLINLSEYKIGFVKIVRDFFDQKSILIKIFNL